MGYPTALVLCTLIICSTFLITYSPYFAERPKYASPNRG